MRWLRKLWTFLRGLGFRQPPERHPMVLVAYPFVKPQFFDNSGAMAIGMKLFVYLAGTSTKTNTWVDALGVGLNTNPIILDAAGRASIFLAPGTYKYVLAPANDTDPPVSPIWTEPDIVAYAGFTSTTLNAYVNPGASTWTKPAGANAITVTIMGGGGGGGSGRRGAAGTIRGGGGGGASGAYTTQTFPASLLGATETVTVGAAGTGAAGITVNDTSGSAGTGGGQSSFGTWATANGGPAGGGGTAGVGGPGGAGPTGGTIIGVSGGTGGDGTNVANAGVAGPYLVGGGGGGGGGISAANASQNGANGGNATSIAGGLGGVVGASNATVGTGVTSGNVSGGGGGGGGAATDHLNGANAGIFGGGGGAGGASLNGTTSGNGGSGAQGIVLVLTVTLTLCSFLGRLLVLTW